MIGRRWRAPLGLLLGLNSALGPNAAFVGVTLVSIAASVALATSLEISSRAVQTLARETAEALAGGAALEVVSGELGVPEALVETVAAVPGVSQAAPLIEATLGLDEAHMPLHVLGLDLLAAEGTRELEARGRGDVRMSDPLEMLARTDAVLISERVAAQLGVGFGDAIRVRTPLGMRALHVEGLLADRGLARAFAGQVAVMDVFALQALLERTGFVDRIRVTAAPGTDVGDLERRVAAAIGGAAAVQRAGARTSALDLAVDALRAAVLVIAAVGAGIAGLLSYAAMSTAVERRLPELAVLRSIGFSARDVARLIAADAALLAALGTAAGFAAGRLLGGLFLPAVTQSSEYFIHASANASHVSFTGQTVAVGLGVGLACAFAGALGPARIATGRYALDARSAPRGPTPQRVGWSSALLALALAALVLVPGPTPRARLVLELAAGALLAGSLVGRLLQGVDRIRPALGRMLPGFGHLVGTGLAVRLRGTALAVAAITAVVAFVQALLILSASFGETLLEMVSTRYPEAIVVSASPPYDDASVGRLTPEVVAAIRAVPGVDAFVAQEIVQVRFRGEDVTLIALDAKVAAPRTGTTRYATHLSAVLRDLARGEVAVSGAFARRFGVRAGDDLELLTPQGARRFHVAGETRSLAGPAGVITMDLASYDAHWRRSGARAALLWVRGDPAAVLEEIRRATWALQPLFFSDGAELLRRATAFAYRFDVLLFAVAALALFLGGIAIGNLLLGSVAARRRELALLRAAGAEPGQLVWLVLADAALIALASSALGLALGTLLGAPTLEIFADDFGLIVDRHSDPLRLAVFLALVVAAVLASALYPALLARRSADLGEPEAG